MNTIFRGKKVIIILTAVFVLAVTIGFMCVQNSIKYPFKITNDKEFEVKNGDTLYSVLNRLNSEGVIKNVYLVKAYIKYKKVSGNIKPGLYALESDESINEFINSIRKGEFDKNNIFVTIPEGYTVNQIAQLLEQKGVISKDKFIEACKEYKKPDYVETDSKRNYELEGYLFPDTYELKAGMKGKDILDIMLKNFSKKFTALLKKDNISLDKSKYDNILIMASIVEGEAEQDSERPVIASVFYNRLKIKMKLQSCATVEYVLGKHKEKLYNKDTQIQSVYNTYLVDGLPEGPICNPGIKSIEVALNPSSTDYLYFVSYNNGTHFFTKDVNKFEEVKKQTQGSY